MIVTNVKLGMSVSYLYVIYRCVAAQIREEWNQSVIMYGIGVWYWRAIHNIK
jgi:hypothetical protein